ncbi:MAG: hypothetical protein QM757_23850 [Paludibaculum sp.]
MMPMAKSAALRALDLDPDLAEAHTSLGLIESLYEWRWKEAGAVIGGFWNCIPAHATAQHSGTAADLPCPAGPL